MRNEKTGRKAGSAAGRVQARLKKIDGRCKLYIKKGGAFVYTGLVARDVKSPAASALTQVVRPPRKRAKG